MADAVAELVTVEAHAPSPVGFPAQASFPPINFIYGHFHNSIRAELSLLADRVRSLEVPAEGVESMLTDLRERYKFLEQVYKYHSAVEDEVLYPTLDSKVPNVTLAYSIEHQDEEILFEQLSQLLTTALEETESKRKGTIRALICKVEEIHTTLRKHLAKEEEQLLPLLLQHFSFAEQAELVAQFLYSIPLETVERVLSNLKRRIPRDEQEQLLIEIRNVIPDNLLSQLLITWLRPAADVPQLHTNSNHAERSPVFVCCGSPSSCMYSPHATVTGSVPGVLPRVAGEYPKFQAGRGICQTPCDATRLANVLGVSSLSKDDHIRGSQVPEVQKNDFTNGCFRSGVGGDNTRYPTAAATVLTGIGAAVRAPLHDIIHFHRIICSSLEAFTREARALQLNREITVTHLSALLERHRFLRSVYVFHSISEEEVLFPEVQRLAANVGGKAANQCEKDHQAELSSFEDLGRLLADVRSFARRGRKEAVSMLEKLCCSAEAVQASIQHHMDREESDVFPLLELHLCEAQQRVLVYRTIRAMPLRLLERVMPWLVSDMDDDDAASLLSNIRLGAPACDLPLVELLSRWARRGRPRMALLSALEDGVSRTSMHGARAAPARFAGDLLRLEGSMPPEVPGGVGGLSGAHTWEAAGVRRDTSVGMETCGPRFLRDSFPDSCASHFVVTNADDDGAGKKRQRVSSEVVVDAQGAELPHIGANPHVDTSAAVATTSGACQGVSSDSYCLTEMELSTAPRALLRSYTCESPDGVAIDCTVLPGQDNVQRGVQAHTRPQHGGGDNGSGYNPIDHIFQFHKALRQELKQMEADAMRLEHIVLSWVRQQQLQLLCQQQPLQPEGTLCTASGQDDGTGEVVLSVSGGSGQPSAHQLAGSRAGTSSQRALTPSPHEHVPTSSEGCGVAAARAGLLPVLQNFHGRFQFLQGIYRAHSKSEDEIVFPALEAKQALRNVSHAYTLDHRQEEQLFADLEAAIDKFRAVDLLQPGHEQELSRQVMGVRRMCAAIRASLETHIRSEESELWPLFSEHFSREEQQYLVGVIIGRTGAQVLQALLPWVSDTFSEEERDAMMDSLRAATRNTMFDQWLEAVQAGGAGAGAGVVVVDAGSSASGNSCVDSGAPSRSSSLGAGDMALIRHHPNSKQPLKEVAEYLAGSGHDAAGESVGGSSRLEVVVGGGAASVSAVADNTSFRPGWEDIFRMNQQQLEAAIHRVSNDDSLEPERKAYLMQNIMVSKYIVAQQRRMGALEGHVDAERNQLQQHQMLQVQGAGMLNRTSAATVPGLSDGHRAADSATLRATATDLGCELIQRTFQDVSAGILGCQHYQRKCQLVAPCCGKIFTCRLCHDEVCDHRMDRYAVSEMRCMLCGSRQPVGGTCCSCGAAIARYVCNICHLFDDEPGKDIYHCPFCNVCRRGRGLGVDFFHCMNCNACMSLSLFRSHKCREKCIEGNCPVCHEALFDSSQPIKELPCGHFMHSSCFLTYTQYNYTCPLCCKSVGDMSVYFQMLDSLLASERLPPEYSGRMQHLLCNDCGKMGFAPFHFVYHSCPHCRSYNTRVLCS